MTAQIARRTRHPLSDGNPPSWASAWGHDPFGPWVEFELPASDAEPVTQRLRWIPPGRFLMGSPKSEEGRWENEGPRHEVVLSQGYWLFDTPCTQALWLAVMGGETPSRLKSNRRPVEQVSFEDVGKFITKINRLVEGLGWSLPTEAQWEYACRAGTEGPSYGPLDEVAWHSNNSGGQTHDVGQKAANGWGLYDMLGNVWEWCFDGMRPYTKETEVDPVGPPEAGSRRVIRGGGWGDTAQGVRAACRGADPPDDRHDFLGFRCLSSGR